MYYDHFGLTQAPFKITPNTDFFFTGGNRGSILEALIYAITHGEGIVKVTGEVGSGKTMLCSMLQARLPANVESVYLANPSVAPEEVLHAIAFELHLDVPREAEHLTVMHALQHYLIKRHADGKRVVIFIEESQSMPLPTLEEIRLLSNLETRNDKLLQIVLFGQPELDENLRQPNIRQLRDRIAHSFRLEPLTAQEGGEYLTFRMRAAGYKGPDVFPPSVVKHITRAASGLTRRINLIADKALLAAFSENTHMIRRRHIDAALRDSEFSEKRMQARGFARFIWPAAAMLCGAAIGASVYAFVGRTPPGAAPLAAAPPPVAAVVAQPAAAVTPVEPERAPTTAAKVAPDPKQAVETAATKSTAAPVVVTPAVPAPAKETAMGSAAELDDAVGARIAMTQRWLARQPAETYSIQLMGTPDESQLKHHLNILSKSIEMNHVFVYRTVARGKPSLTVLYGAYSERSAAESALADLPAPLKSYRPLLRTVQGIRREISQPASS